MIDYVAINSNLLYNAESLVTTWLPGGVKRGHEYLPLNPRRDDKTVGSFSINLRTGAWLDGATNDRGGDLISLYSYINNVSQSEAAKTLSSGTISIGVKSRGRPKTTPEDNGYTLCLPVPDNAPEAYKTLKFPDGKYRKPSMIHTYTDANGAVLRLIYRFEAGNEGLPHKEFRPLTCWRDNTGRLLWRFKDIPNKRLLYQLESLTKRINDIVLVVSGEKCVDAIKNILKGYVVVTWSGGDNGVAKTDFSPLQGRQIIWWPDNDDSSRNAMRRLADKFGGRTICINADKYPKGWDCADAVMDGINIEQFISAETVTYIPRLTEIAPADIFVHRSENGKLLGTIENLQALMDYYKLNVYYNQINKTREYSIAGVKDESGNIDSFYSIVRSACNLNELPRHDVVSFIDYLSTLKVKNPVLDWINSRPWDGKTRVNLICDALECDETMPVEFKETLILKWLVSAYAAVSRKDGDDFRTRGVLVLHGRQYMGKTTFLRHLCGANWGGNAKWYGEGLTLDAESRDSIMKTQRVWIVELGELESTTKKTMPAIKAFLTNPVNIIRLPYAKAETILWSRTVYTGTVNQQDVLVDLTGNSRFWCLPLLNIKDISDIDMQQVWAEVKYFKEEQGVTWWLTHEEEVQLEIENQNYIITSPIEELLEEKLNWNTDQHKDMWGSKTCTVILKDCGMANPTQNDARRAAYYMRKRLGMDKAPKISTGGARFYPCPPLYKY